MPFGPFWTDTEQVHFLPMKRGRRTDALHAQRMGEMIRYWYFQLGRTEREIASELGMKCSTVNYYKNRQKR